MYHIPLAHSNTVTCNSGGCCTWSYIQPRNNRRRSENFSIQHWHIYVGSPQWLVPLGKRTSVTRLSLGQGYPMELVCVITILECPTLLLCCYCTSDVTLLFIVSYSLCSTRRWHYVKMQAKIRWTLLHEIVHATLLLICFVNRELPLHNENDRYSHSCKNQFSP